MDRHIQQAVLLLLVLALLGLALWLAFAKSRAVGDGSGVGGDALPINHRLLLLQHVDASKTARILPIQFTNGTPVHGSTTDIAVADNGYMYPHDGVIVSACETQWVTAVQANAERWELHVYGDNPGTPTVVPISEPIVTSLSMIDHRVLVGAGDRVGAVNLSEAPPAFKLLASRRVDPLAFPNPRKAYDLFARDRDFLLAIDDVIYPMYTELLKLDGGHGVTHLESWELPPLINGSYQLASLDMHEPEQTNGTLYAVSRSEVRSGSGQRLAAIPIRNGKLEDYSHHNPAFNAPPRLGEFTPREGFPDPTGPTTLYGKTPTKWTGLARISGREDRQHLALAAGKRGVLLLPSDFDETTKASAVNLGGSCHDILNKEGTIYALTSKRGNSHLLILTWAEGTLKVQKRFPLPEVMHRFVR